MTHAYPQQGQQGGAGSAPVATGEHDQSGMVSGARDVTAVSHRRMARWLLASALALAGVMMQAPVAEAQSRAPGASAAERQAMLQQQRERWETVSEADRRAIQDSLVWLGLYNGVVDGTFGQRTADAIAAFEQRELLQPGAVIAGPGLAVLRAAADRQKAEVGFVLMDDPATGTRIGAPGKLFDRKETTPGRTRLSSSRGPGALTLFSGGPDDGDLPSWFARATAAEPGRKITYKVLRPDFAVVSGEEGPRRFFSRVGAGPEGLRGFTFVYPASAAARMDRVTIAIANSFVPFAMTPGAPAAPGAATTAAQSTPGVGAAGQAQAPFGATAQGGPVAATPATLAGVALLAAPGRAITATAAVRGCRDIRVGAFRATVSASDRQSGLSLLSVDGLTLAGAAPIALAAASPALTPASAIRGDASEAGAAEQMRLTLATFVIGPDGVPALTALGGDWGRGAAGATGASGAVAVTAALPAGGAGALVLDATGALAGVASAVAPAATINGVSLAASHPVASVADVTRMLQEARAPLAPGSAPDPSARAANAQTTGAAVAHWRTRLAPVRCL